MATGTPGPRMVRTPEFAESCSAPVTGFDRVTVAPSNTTPIGARRPWFDAPQLLDVPLRPANLTPDGRVIYVQADVEALVRALRVVPNWVTKWCRTG